MRSSLLFLAHSKPFSLLLFHFNTSCRYGRCAVGSGRATGTYRKAYYELEYRWIVWAQADTPDGESRHDDLSEPPLNRSLPWSWRGSSWRVRGVYSHAEDARAFRLDGRIFMAFNRKFQSERNAGTAELGSRMYVAALEPRYVEAHLTIDPPHASRLNGVLMPKLGAIEKNWAPFVHNNTL